MIRKQTINRIREARIGEIFFKWLGNSVVFMAAFMLVGTLAPVLWYNFFDNTAYIIQEVPFTVEKSTYTSCEIIRATFEQYAAIDISGINLQELVLVRADLSVDSVVTLRQDSFIEQGENKVTVRLPLPCDLEDGLYFWQGILIYEVHGVKKEAVWHTEKFLVTNI